MAKEAPRTRANLRLKQGEHEGLEQTLFFLIEMTLSITGRPAHLILIHGVGNPKPGSITENAASLLQRAGFAVEEIHEFNWNQHVTQPVKAGFLTPRSLSEFSKALLNAAWFGFEDEGWFKKSIFLLLEPCLAMLPIAMAGGFFLKRPAIATTSELSGFGARLHLSVAHVLQGWVAVLACLLFLALTAAIFDSHFRYFSHLRRLLLLFIWPFVHLALVPFLMPWPMAALFGLAILVRGCVTYRMDMITQPGLALELAIFLAALLLAAVLMLGALIGQGVVAPQVKLMADVIRYIGLADYTRALQQHLRDFTARMNVSDESHLFVVAHSLGSVIAVDFLSDPSCPLSKNLSVSLVTLGSPLRRFFARFFAQAYRSPTEIGAALRERFSGFIWINIYRPFDYIGARLALRGRGMRDISTRQYLRFHTGYWSDNAVFDLASTAVDNLQSMDLCNRVQSGVPTNSNAKKPTAIFEPAAWRWVALFVMLTLMVAGIGSLGYMRTFRWNPEIRKRTETAVRARVDRDPVEVKGIIKRRYGIQPIGPQSGDGTDQFIEYKIFELKFEPQEKGSHEVVQEYGRALKSDRAFEDLHWSEDEASVQVRYNKADPADFYLPYTNLGGYVEPVDRWSGALNLLFMYLAPTAGLAFLYFVTLLGLLRTRPWETSSRDDGTPTSSAGVAQNEPD